MRRDQLAVALVLMALFCQANAVHAQANVSSIFGIWRGQGHQSPAGSAGADWSILMSIEKGGGSIEYPSLGCGGTLAEISNDGTSAQFREHITHMGKSGCVDGGLITVNLSKGALAWAWTGTDRGTVYNAVATLAK